MNLLTDIQKTKIISILSQHSLIFGEGIVFEEDLVTEESINLMNCLDNLDESSINRLISIIRQYRLLFGSGLVQYDNKSFDEANDLIEKLLKYLKPQKTGRVYIGDLIYKKEKFLAINLLKEKFSFTPNINQTKSNGVIIIVDCNSKDCILKIEAIKECYINKLNYIKNSIQLEIDGFYNFINFVKSEKQNKINKPCKKHNLDNKIFMFFEKKELKKYNLTLKSKSNIFYINNFSGFDGFIFSILKPQKEIPINKIDFIINSIKKFICQ
ncbi:MAG: hypothetical protein A2086_12760 [Spirochaetes bacterium GWD1_27_9]|nr:MAG: hypothetical protein A2Z98_17975 [Spirochaetes bacterium GWB1_27_13]OHD24029.1 MAG: hypothetical protein A2Y34_14005 [Spirochaetes bacterium GWC1_27_15]OHD43949.1 MAG: hypothetical protein A2086_12760 [Spirochaetes bacterium GWD1_27_9]